MKKEDLSGKATMILRKAGFTWSGRPRSEVDRYQCIFEKKIILTPVGGQIQQKSRRR